MFWFFLSKQMSSGIYFGNKNNYLWKEIVTYARYVWANLIKSASLSALYFNDGTDFTSWVFAAP